MDKESLARCLVAISCRARKERYNIEFYNLDIFSDLLNMDDETLASFFSNAAGSKKIKGRLPRKGSILVSRGEELPIYRVKPIAVIEYSRHWPYDYCYVYRL